MELTSPNLAILSSARSTLAETDAGGLRAALVTEARSWLGTPYVRRAMVKGSGADCASFLLACLRNVGLVSMDEARDELKRVFSDDWFCHASDEQYKLRVLRHAELLCECVGHRTAEIAPGNLLLIRTAGSRRYNHGGLCVGWPRVVHAVAPCVEEIDATRHPMWTNKVVAVFDPFPKI
jgi:cell wall-associated NlpC family hydrolase